jgi:hypothetical protein
MMLKVAIAARQGESVGQPDDPHAVDLRIPLAELTSRQVRIRLGRGRVELGQARGSAVRVRITGPRGGRFRRPPKLQVVAGELVISARQARVQVDIPEASQLRTLVEVSRGEVTSWGAGGQLELLCDGGTVTCRELVADRVLVRAARISLHFAAAPRRVDARGEQITVTAPAGEYAVDAPPDAQVSVDRQPESDREIVVRGTDVRVLASQSPLRLTDEPGCAS